MADEVDLFFAAPALKQGLFIRAPEAVVVESLGVRLAVRIGASAVRNFLYLVLAGLLATLIWRFVI